MEFPHHKSSSFMNNFIICRKRNYKTKFLPKDLHQSYKMSLSNHFSDSTHSLLPKLNSIVFNLEVLNKYIQAVNINPNQDILIQNTIDRVETIMASIVNNLNGINSDILKTEAPGNLFDPSNTVENDTPKEDDKSPKEKTKDVKSNKKKIESWAV